MVRVSFASSRKAALVQTVSLLALFAMGRAADAQTVNVPPVTVTAPNSTTPDQALQTDGTAASGYRSDLLSNVGALGPTKVLDTPYSVSVVPGALIENLQANSTDDVFNIDPFTQNNFPQARGNPFSVLVRGFSTTATFDNMRTDNTAVVDVEGLQRVEVVQGLSGFLYGPASPGGIVNFVFKRPTSTRFATLTVGDYSIGDYSAGTGYVHGDFGGPIDKDGQFAYRVNLVGQDGNTAIEDQSLVRNYESVALDWHVAPNVLAQFLTFHSFHKYTSPDPFWIVSSSAEHPSALLIDRNYSEPWGYYQDEQELAQTKLTWTINPIFAFRFGFTYVHDQTFGAGIDNSISDNSGTYSQSAVIDAPSDLQTFSGYGLIDAKFDAGPVKNTVTGGFFGERYSSDLPNDDGAFPTSVGPLSGGLFSLASPSYSAPPAAVVGTLPSSPYFTWGNENVVLGDQAEWGPFTLIAGVTHSQIIQDQYGPYLDSSASPRSLTSQYNTGQFTPSASLLYKIMPNLSVYGTYIQGLEPGGVAPTGTANAGTGLAPELDQQYEVGAKARVKDALLTLALFDINKAYTYTDPTDNVFKESGREDHKGIELGASGKVLPEFTLYGGVTLLDPHVTNDPALDGLRPENVSSRIVKVYGEYAVPFIHGLTLTGGVFYYGSFAANPQNTEFLPGYVTENAGLRYQTLIDKVPLTARLNVTNISNQSYWMSTSFVGQPRQIALSLEAHF